MNPSMSFEVAGTRYGWSVSNDREVMFYSVGNPVDLGLMTRAEAAEEWDVDDVMYMGNLDGSSNPVAVFRAAWRAIGAWVRSEEPPVFWFRTSDAKKMRVYESMILRDDELLSNYDVLGTGDTIYLTRK